MHTAGVLSLKNDVSAQRIPRRRDANPEAVITSQLPRNAIYGRIVRHAPARAKTPVHPLSSINCAIPPTLLETLDFLPWSQKWLAKATVINPSCHSVCSSSRPADMKRFFLGTCDANDAVHITVVQPGEEKPKTLSSFHPQFTYPIFGDEEQIFGYRGLIIRLRFAAHDLRPHVFISYDEKFKTVGDASAVDLLKTLKPWLPEGKRFVHVPCLSFSSRGRFLTSMLDLCRGLYKPPRLRESGSRRGGCERLRTAGQASAQLCHRAEVL